MMQHSSDKYLTLSQILTSEEWKDHFQSLSKSLGFNLSLYDQEGNELFSTEENPYCMSMKSLVRDKEEYQEPCRQKAFEAVNKKEPVFYKCEAGLLSFALPVTRLDETAVVLIKAGFVSYDDLLKFTKTARGKGIRDIPVKNPLRFVNESYVKAISNYINLTINRLLNTAEEKSRHEEKLLRMTSLFDSRTFRQLSKNKPLLQRYILDTVEFVFGQIPAAIMVRDDKTGVYRTEYSAGRNRDLFEDCSIAGKSSVMNEIISSQADISIPDVSLESGLEGMRDIRSLHLFPIFSGDTIEYIISIFDTEFFREDLKIMNAFRDYVQINLENSILYNLIKKSKKSDESLISLSAFSHSLISILDRRRLFNAVLEKSLQLLKAEQGSLMLLDTAKSELIVEAVKSADDTVKERMRFGLDDSIAGHVLQSGEPLLVRDIEKDPRVGKANSPRYRSKSFISAMLKIEDRISGVINVSDKAGGREFDETDLTVLQSLLGNSAIAIERSMFYERAEELKQLSITDPLTGIYNRRYLNIRMNEEITRYSRYKHPFSFMMLDLDKFKDYNDTFGHIAGDNLIKQLASVLANSLRTMDIAARFGGDEFVAVFPQTPKVDAIQITHRLKDKIDKEFSQKHVEMPLTLSIGLATCPDDASSIMELIDKTDQALYLAKKGGGNRVVYL
jgi:diguanylate cyclase (GGDEF)-like protein